MAGNFPLDNFQRHQKKKKTVSLFMLETSEVLM